jgi:TonB family protein
VGFLFSFAIVQSSFAISPEPIFHGKKSLAAQEVDTWKPLTRDSKLVAIPQSTSVGACESTQLPEPLTTPSPLLDQAPPVGKLTVSFVIGIDGLVHSAILLKSIGHAQDRSVLNVLRSWRYRPAMCNGVPAEAEATVDFSSRRISFGLE